MKNLMYLIISILILSCDEQDNNPEPVPSTISINGNQYTSTKAIWKKSNTWSRVEAVIADFQLTTTYTPGVNCRVNDSNSWPEYFKEIHFDFVNYNGEQLESGSYIVSSDSNGGLIKLAVTQVAERTLAGYDTYFATSGNIIVVANTINQTLLITGSFVANDITYTLPSTGVIIPYDVCL